jgi:hypothetical protein
MKKLQWCVVVRDWDKFHHKDVRTFEQAKIQAEKWYKKYHNTVEIKYLIIEDGIYEWVVVRQYDGFCLSDDEKRELNL